MLKSILDWLSANWFPLLVIIYIVGMMLYGHDRGFLKLAVSMFALVLTIFLVRLALPHVTGYLHTHTGIENGIKESLLKQTGLNNVTDSQVESTEGQQQAIAGLNLPENLKTLLSKNNTAEFWNKLGVSKFREYVAGYLSGLFVNYIGFALLFIIIWILLHLLIRFADIFTKLPVLHGLNQIAGAVLGLVEALCFVWIGFIILNAFSGTFVGSKLLNEISQSRWLSYLYANNFIGFLLKDILSAMI